MADLDILADSLLGNDRKQVDLPRSVGKTEEILDRAEAHAKGDETETLRATLHAREKQLKRQLKVIKTQDETIRDFENEVLEIVRDAVGDHLPSQNVELFNAPEPHDFVDDPHEHLLLVSDSHYGEVVDPEVLYGVGYNPDIASRRMQTVLDKTLRRKEMYESDYPITAITPAFIGDMISGAIHEEIRKTNAIPEAQQWLEMGDMIADFCLVLRQHYPVVKPIIIPGNHPRLTEQRNHKEKWNNLEWMMGHYVAAKLSDTDIDVQVPKQIVYVHEVLGHRIALTHGDNFRASKSFAGLPFYSLAQRRAKFQEVMKSIGAPGVDMLCLGHFHQMLYWPGRGCDIIMNGSIKGPDEYVFDEMYAFEAPQQVLLTINETYSVADFNQIDLKDVT